MTTASQDLRLHVRRARRALRTWVKARLCRAGLVVERLLAPARSADLAIFHAFRPPPEGGGHQFLRALWGELARRGLRIENNTISARTRACLFNSFNFDFDRLRYLRRKGCRMVHRVDGPIGVYRGWDDGTDERIWRINHELAEATIFQSHYSLQQHRELGLTFRAPCVIPNAADPRIFHPRGRVPFDRRRKVRLIATSWSDNPNKGAATYRWLEQHLDWDRFDFTFVGRSKMTFERIRMIPPLPSADLAEVLRQHDIYLTASTHEACSNALIEALSCGLPAIYVNSGSHAELVGAAGFGFDDQAELPALLDRLVEEYEVRQARIAVPALSEVADRYVAVLGLDG
jgi:glycosyltransferase involved in cell wall biosynthesis